jgi:hypothetical protein
MGIDIVGLEAILISLKYVTNKKNLLTLARQGIHMYNADIDNLLNKHNLSHLTNKYGRRFDWCERLLHDLKFEQIDSIDNSPYEGATIIHNMNNPIPKTSKKYNFIFDGGTIEHIFNTAQVCENIIDLLEVGGIFCSVTCNNNFSGHGIYQFSPEFFLSAFNKKYGMEIQELYLSQTDNERENWINVNDYNINGGGRNCKSFDSTKPVYIIAIIKKISDTRENLITNSPNQYSYEMIDWKK